VLAFVAAFFSFAVGDKVDDIATLIRNFLAKVIPDAVV
jgi:hypothetical protein